MLLFRSKSPCRFTSGLLKGKFFSYVYFVFERGTLQHHDRLKIKQILPDVDFMTEEDALSLHAQWVLPRVGTVSPWSSKATEIFHNCGLNQLERVERGRLLLAEDIDPTLQTHDPLTESVYEKFIAVTASFNLLAPAPGRVIKILEQGRSALTEVNDTLGLCLSGVELDYLYDHFTKIGRDPTQSELMMFSQVNSEHCRHKIFNAPWVINEERKTHSLFSMIKNTHQASPDNVVVAYNDNAAILHGYDAQWFDADNGSHEYNECLAKSLIVFKVETHNHPTAISPHPGAATGSGGEIRDEGATGRGAKPRAGLCGFSVSHLNLPGEEQPWSLNVGKPSHVASPLDIMIDGPLGAAAFNNEFGRPNLCGYFRTFCSLNLRGGDNHYFGYHKPIMLAGGIGAIRPGITHKNSLPVDTPLVVLGGPSFAIGIGGGSASSREHADGNVSLDFASVQRANPEMQRRCQEVINACSRATQNPILSIHDVGAGGLSNALPEIVNDAKRGASIALRSIFCADVTLSPMEIWCNESQERYVLAIEKSQLAEFEAFCRRERCPFVVVGSVTEQQHLRVDDTLLKAKVIDLAMDSLFEKMPKQTRVSSRPVDSLPAIDTTSIVLAEAVERVLKYPCVASKRFLITIGDRSVGGLTARDQLVGPSQVPVADVAVTSNDFVGMCGEALAMGERAPLAVIDAAKSARMAVGEAITNIAAAPIEQLGKVSLSANWMAASDAPFQGAALYDAVQAVGMDLCPELGLAIPVGKDSLSMQSSWSEGGVKKSVMSPVSLVISAAASVYDVTLTLTPELNQQEKTALLLVDLGEGMDELGGSVLAQVYQQIGDNCPDVRSPSRLKGFFSAIQKLNQRQLLLAYHDRSDGGLLACVTEMMFASQCGITLQLPSIKSHCLSWLFSEELGAVIQVKSSDLEEVNRVFSEYGLSSCLHVIGGVNETDCLRILEGDECLYNKRRQDLQSYWEQPGMRLRLLRDNPQSVKSESKAIRDDALKLHSSLSKPVSFNRRKVTASSPKVAILREQGVNGHLEMAAAFQQAGFQAVDVHMSDLLAGQDLSRYAGLVACGGFSYGDVLNAGRGWAQTILHQSRLTDVFSSFFARSDTFSLGVCNGCQMLSQLKDLIPGAANWPTFSRNESDQFESRMVMVKIKPSSAVLLQGLDNAVLPVVVAHGEGRVVQGSHQTGSRAVMNYVDSQHQLTERYPLNPNGSKHGETAFTSSDGRALIMMPHPERVFLTKQFSWLDHDLKQATYSPWMQLFQSAYQFAKEA